MEKTIPHIMSIISISFLLSVFFNGCTTIPKIPAFDDESATVVFDMGYDDVWNTLKNVAEESYTLYILDKDDGIMESTRTLEFSKVQLYRQYVVLHLEVRKISLNFTAVTVNFNVSRYDPTTYIWNYYPGANKQQRFISKVKTALEGSKS